MKEMKEMMLCKKKISCTRLSSFTKRSKAPPPLDAKADRRSGASLTHVERYLFENFRSLYDRMDLDHINDGCRSNLSSSNSRIREVDNDDDDDDLCKSFYINEPVDFSPRLTDPQLEIIRASKRFFTSPIIASSLMEEARLSGAATASAAFSLSSKQSKTSAGASGVASCSEAGTAVTVLSEKPYEDFRRSMAELMEAHHAEKALPELDWEFMEEMLLSFLELNDRSVHQHILKAFTDLSATSDAAVGALGRRRKGIIIS